MLKFKRRSWAIASLAPERVFKTLKSLVLIHTPRISWRGSCLGWSISGWIIVADEGSWGNWANDCKKMILQIQVENCAWVAVLMGISVHLAFRINQLASRELVNLDCETDSLVYRYVCLIYKSLVYCALTYCIKWSKLTAIGWLT